MTIDELVREELNDLAGSYPAPTGLADRAIASRVRRQRLGQASAAILALAGVIGVALAVPSATNRLYPPADRPQPRNVVFAMHRGVWDNVRQLWRVLDPSTGNYRDVDVFTVSAPTTDLRYAAVTPRFVYPPAGGMPEPQEKKIGRYDTASGDIRWYDIPISPGSTAAISPDGRYVALIGGRSDAAQLIVVDLGTGHASTVDLDHAVLSAMKRRRSRAPIDWLPDSRRLVIENQVVDLTGRRVGELRLPDSALILSVRPGGNGLLVDPTRHPYMPGQAQDDDGRFALTDTRGRTVVDRTATCFGDPNPSPSVPGPGASTGRCSYDFVGWRGPDEILISPADPLGEQLYTLNLRTGETTPIHRIPGSPRIDALIVVSADRLPAPAQPLTF
jgi:hypothetical protein